MKKLFAPLIILGAAVARGQAVRADGGVVTGVTGAVGTSRTISTTSPLAGGGDLSANRTFSLGIVPATLGGLGADESAATGVTLFNAGTVTVAPGTATTVLHGNAAGIPAFSGVDLVNDALANQGNVNVVLHGNGAGQPSFGAVINGDFSGTLAANHGGFGTDMSAQTGYTHWAAGTPTTAELAATNIHTIADALLSTTNAVDVNSATATLLYTVPAGKTCVVTRIVVRNASISLTTASIAFGYNTPTWDDVVATATYTELTGSTLYTIVSPKVGAAVGAATGTLKVLPTILQGAPATVSVDVFGFVF